MKVTQTERERERERENVATEATITKSDCSDVNVASQSLNYPVANSTESLAVLVSTRSTIEVRPTALPHPHALDSASAAGVGGATPHASPSHRAADDVTIETCYRRQSVDLLCPNPNP